MNELILHAVSVSVGAGKIWNSGKTAKQWKVKVLEKPNKKLQKIASATLLFPSTGLLCVCAILAQGLFLRRSANTEE